MVERDAGKRGVSCSEVDEIPFYIKDCNHLYGGEGFRAVNWIKSNFI